jgi:outer membrane protein assembly factor BamD (BamD/ComL family)
MFYNIIAQKATEFEVDITQIYDELIQLENNVKRFDAVIKNYKDINDGRPSVILKE